MHYTDLESIIRVWHCISPGFMSSAAQTLMMIKVPSGTVVVTLLFVTRPPGDSPNLLNEFW